MHSDRKLIKKMKIRPIILVILTLAIGFVLGILVSAQVRFHRLKPVRIFFSEERFREGFYNILQPDDKQKLTIDQILSRYAKANNSLVVGFRRRSDSLMKEFWKEIEPNLTIEQQERLKELEQRRMQMIRQGRREQQDRRDQNDSLGFRPRRGMPPGAPPRDFDRRVRHPREEDTTGYSRM
jgi:hypothetical protein